MEKISDIIESIANEKGLDPIDVKERVIRSLINAAKYVYGDNYEYDVTIDANKTPKIYQKIVVVADDDERLSEQNEHFIALSEAKKHGDVDLGDELTYEISLDGRTASQAFHKELEYHVQRLVEEKIFKRYDILVDYAYYKLPKNSIDLLFIGSSHSYCTFNTHLFDHYLECNSLNLGTDSQSLSITYSAILEILKKQNPKVIVIEIYPIERQVETLALRSHLDTMGFSINKLRLIKNALSVSEIGKNLTNTIYYHI